MAEEFVEYDDTEAVAYVRNYIPLELKEKVSDDDIYYFLDLIGDYYESRGFLDLDEDDDTLVEIDEDELVDYIIKNAKRDEVGQFSEDEVRFIVQGELAYCESIELLD